MREIDGTLIAPTTEEEATLAALNSEADDLEEKWANEDCVPDEVNARLEAIDVEIVALVDRPISFHPADLAHAGALMSIEDDGSLWTARGSVRPVGEPADMHPMTDPAATRRQQTE